MSEHGLMEDEIKCPTCGTALTPEDTEYRCTECDEVVTMDDLYEDGQL
jgi:DNA-directed RNA polymerase subunit RPC12/RpoP